VVATLKPICEGKRTSIRKWASRRTLADDFRNRPFNRALKGIGTLAMTPAALEDLQAIQKYDRVSATD
jgi:hypothetical protein